MRVESRHGFGVCRAVLAPVRSCLKQSRCGAGQMLGEFKITVAFGGPRATDDADRVIVLVVTAGHRDQCVVGQDAPHADRVVVRVAPRAGDQ